MKLTPRAGDTREQGLTLHPMTSLITRPKELSDPNLEHAGRPEEMGPVMKREKRKHQVKKQHVLDRKLESTHITGEDGIGADYWPPIGKCHSCGFEAHERLRGFRITRRDQYNSRGSTGHMARVARALKFGTCTQHRRRTMTAAFGKGVLQRTLENLI